MPKRERCFHIEWYEVPGGRARWCKICGWWQYKETGDKWPDDRERLRLLRWVSPPY